MASTPRLDDHLVRRPVLAERIVEVSGKSSSLWDQRRCRDVVVHDVGVVCGVISEDLSVDGGGGSGIGGRSQYLVVRGWRGQCGVGRVRAYSHLVQGEDAVDPTLGLHLL